MDSTFLRPTFEVPVDLPRTHVVDSIRERLVSREDLQGLWRGKGIWAELYVPQSERRLWSPYLSIRVDEDEEGCHIFGRFGPHPEVWTFFMFLYFGVAFLVAFGGTFGYVQWASSEPAWAFWAVWLGLPFLGLLHLASAFGRRLGQAQMRHLKGIFDEVLEEVVESA